MTIQEKVIFLMIIILRQQQSQKSVYDFNPLV